MDSAKGPSSARAGDERRGSKPACAGSDGATPGQGAAKARVADCDAKAAKPLAEAKGPSSSRARDERRGSEPAGAGSDGAKRPSTVAAMTSVHVRFDPALDAFLPPARRGVEFAYDAAERATVKHAIEALGVPHTEVGTASADGQPVALDHLLRDGEHLLVGAVPPAAVPAEDPRFVADAHLGRLARYLRFLGVDTLQRNAWDDAELVAIARRDGRIVLTRDRALLMRRDIERGACLRATDPLAQLREVAERFGLGFPRERAARCLLCNAALEPLDPRRVAATLPRAVLERHDAFWRCPACERTVWRGTHWQRLHDRVESTLRGVRPPRGGGADG